MATEVQGRVRAIGLSTQRMGLWVRSAPSFVVQHLAVVLNRSWRMTGGLLLQALT